MLLELIEYVTYKISHLVQNNMLSYFIQKNSTIENANIYLNLKFQHILLTVFHSQLFHYHTGLKTRNTVQ